MIQEYDMVEEEMVMLDCHNVGTEAMVQEWADMLNSFFTAREVKI